VAVDGGGEEGEEGEVGGEGEEERERGLQRVD